MLWKINSRFLASGVVIIMKFLILVFLATVLCTIVHSASIDFDDFDSRIIAGENSVHIPSYAFIGAGGSDTSTWGGGHIISTLHVITSASLIVGFNQWHIGLGFNRIQLHVNFTSFAGVPHADYNALTSANDIGIIFMPLILDFSSNNIQPIALPILDTRLPMENEQGTVVGYGSTSGVSQVLPIVLQSTFQRVQSMLMCLDYYPGTDSVTSFCAFDDSISNACDGDSGGGFVTLLRGIPVLTGVMSTRNLCQLAIPKSYTRVAAYREWIRSIAQV